MAKLFLKIDQQLRIEIPLRGGASDKGTIDYFDSQVGSKCPEIEVNFSLLRESSSSSCGFTISSSSIQEGEISIEHVSESTFDITLKSLLAKVDVYEIHLSAMEEKDVLVVESIGKPRSAITFAVEPHPDPINNHLIKWGDRDYLVASCVSLGSKKKSLEAYLPNK